MMHFPFIAPGAFSFSSLTSVTVGWATPLAIATNVFAGVNFSNATLYLNPPATVSSYTAAPVWTDFLNITLSTNSFLVANNLKMYPNPAQNIVNIDLLDLEDATVAVSDINGRVLFTQKLKNTSNNVNIENLASGIYLFKVSSNKGSATSKVIKQ
jgi:Secretion system C-terminal sorting domain